MKILSETKALENLKDLKTSFKDHIRVNYEHRAKDCLTCETKGVCCTDVHFVNVHITRLEAAAIEKTLSNFSEEKQREIYKRAEETVKKYDLKTSGDTFAQTYSCPLFEQKIGCLVHKEGKPAACIQHACYENKEDLPPDELQAEIESEIEKLNSSVYRRNWSWLPIPLWILKNKKA